MKKIRIGVFGAGRGADLASAFMLCNAEIVALCENIPSRREYGLKQIGKSVTVYDSFDDFIAHPMDAVILANNFHQHAPYAIKCFKRGIHVFSEHWLELKMYLNQIHQYK